MKLLRAMIGLAISVVGSAALFLTMTAPGMARLDQAAAQLAQLEAEAAALAGRVREFEAAAADEPLPVSMLLPGQNTADAGLMLQQNLVDLAAVHGVSLTSFGVEPSPEPSRHTISVVLEGKGALASVARFLAALEQRQPRVAVSRLMLRSTSFDGPPDEAAVTMQLTIWGFHAGAAG
jgi:type II secretory pathway component PulM